MEPEVTVPPRKKREMTEKQRAGLSLGLAALKAKREAVKAKKDAKKAGTVALAAPAAVPAAPAYVSLHEFASFRDDILKAIKPAPAAAAPAAPAVVVAPADPAAVAPKVLTGSELLDSIFFS